MSGTVAQRLRLAIIPIVLAVILFLGLDFYTRSETESLDEQSTSGILIDGYSEGVNTIQFDEEGRISYTLSATRQVSYPNDETTLVEPFIQLYQEDDSRWNIIAATGRILASQEDEGGIDEIELEEDVEIYRMDDFGNRTILTTEKIIV